MKCCCLAAVVAIALSATAAEAGASPDIGQDLPTYQERARKALLKLDTDKDGKLSQAEWNADPRRSTNPRGFARMDANGDGQIEAAEMNSSYAARFARLDTNKDAILSREEQQSANFAAHRR
jgi:hypothetical protein